MVIYSALRRKQASAKGSSGAVLVLASHLSPLPDKRREAEQPSRLLTTQITLLVSRRSEPSAWFPHFLMPRLPTSFDHLQAIVPLPFFDTFRLNSQTLSAKTSNSARLRKLNGAVFKDGTMAGATGISPIAVTTLRPCAAAKRRRSAFAIVSSLIGE
jgi:hypothetical protein